MCGIAGIVARAPNFDMVGTVKAMTRRARHRGPDGEEYFMHERVALGYCRLRAMNPSAEWEQPITYADDRYAIVCDGEIYNRLQLRSELQALGFTLRSHRDAELILAAYSAWGSVCLSRFNGSWSFAIHDRRDGMIFAARDRFGIKPFHYVTANGCFAFASEIGQLLHVLPSIRANDRLISEFLLTGALVQSSDTFFEHVSALTSGHFLLYDLRSDKYKIERYYNLADRVSGGDHRTTSEAIREFRLLFEDSVRVRLLPGARTGVSLSGGLDSSSIALLAAQIHGTSSIHPFSAITAISEDVRTSEEAYAGEVVRAGSLDWVTTRPTYEDFCRLLRHVVRRQEEPFGSLSIFMDAFVMRAANESGVEALLSGQGADALLGCSEYYPAFCIMLWRQGGTRELLRGLRQLSRGNANMTPGHLAAYLAAYSAFELLPTVRYRYYRHRSSYMSRFPPMPQWIRSFASAAVDFRRVQALEIEATALPPLLRYQDRNSMASSIVQRCPFLDHRVVEMAVAMHPCLKIGKGWTKWVVREAMSDLLPHKIAWRRDKNAYEAPANAWISRHMLTMTEIVNSSALIKSLCNPERLRQRYHKLTRRGQWRLYSIALWEEEFGVRL